jgi:hypothetical protein
LLLAGRAPQQPPHAKQRSGRSPQTQGARADDHLKYVSGALAPYIQGSSTSPESAPALPDPGPQAVPVEQPSASRQTWQQALAALGQVLSASEIATWFAEAQLLQFDDGLAVVGVSNIFAREKLATCYQARIAQALSASCGRSVQVQIELGGS